MQKIKESAYLFTLDEASCWKVLACKADNGEAFIGKDLREIAGLDDIESDFLLEKQEFGSENLFVVAKFNGQELPALVLRFFSYSSYMAVCVIFDLPIVSVANVLKNNIWDNMSGSQAFLARANDACRDNAEEEYAYDYISAFVGNLLPLYNSRLQEGQPERKTVLAAIQSAASFAEISVDCNAINASSERYDLDVGNVYSGPFFCAALFALAMSARTFARENSLKILVEWEREGYSISFSFEPVQNDAILGMNFLLEVARHKRIGMVLVQNENEISGEIVPFYADEGLTGVKESGRYLSETEREIFKYNYPE